MIALRVLIALLAVMALISGCNKQQSSEWIPDEQMISEGFLACTTMLDNFDAFDMENATEQELESAMQLAHRSYERCKRQFDQNAKNGAERAFAAHRTAQIRVYELLFESVLSRRFDAMAGYCVILRDILKVLAADLKNLETTADEVKLTPDEERRLAKLYQIDLQTVQVLGVQMRLTCDGVPAGQLRKEREERRKEIEQQMQQSPTQQRKR